MSPLGGKGSAQRRALKFLGAVLLVGAGTLAQAAPVLVASATRSVPARGHTLRPLMLHLPVPLPLATAQRPPLPLDEPRPTGNFRDPLPATEADRGAAQRPAPGFALPWRESREIVNADIVSMVRNYRRDGLPLVHLWQSDQNRIAIGLNSHGMPGIYFTRHVGG